MITLKINKYTIVNFNGIIKMKITEIKFKDFTQFINERMDHASRSRMIDGWEVVATTHGKERDDERRQISQDEWNTFFKKVIAKIATFKVRKNGEYLYRSNKQDISAVLNVDNDKPQLRVITVLPPGKQFAKPGTSKVLVEGVEYIIIEDIELD